MSKHRVLVTVGATLVVLGAIVGVASVVEQPSASKSSPNRFYSEEESGQYHEDRRENQRMLARILGGEGLQASSEPLPDDVMQQMQTVSLRIQAAQEKQTAAYERQQRLSRTLKWAGIVVLFAGCALLLLAGRARKSAEAAAP